MSSPESFNPMRTTPEIMLALAGASNSWHIIPHQHGPDQQMLDLFPWQETSVIRIALIHDYYMSTCWRACFYAPMVNL